MSFARVALLLAAMTGLFLTVGYLIGGAGGMVIALLIAVGMNFFAYWNSDKVVLSMHGARQVTETDAPEFVGMVRDLARRADLPMPKVYILNTPQPNAFATGRNPANAAVAATTGLLNMMSREEVAGVMAHELAHVKNRDTLTMTITATLAGAIGMLANFALFFGGNRENPLGIVGAILVAILAPMAAMMVQMAISRHNEYGADAEGARIAGNPDWLAERAGKAGAGRQVHRQPRRRAQSGLGPSVHRQPAARPQTRQPVQHPPGHRQPGPRPARDGGARRRRWRRAPGGAGRWRSGRVGGVVGHSLGRLRAACRRPSARQARALGVMLRLSLGG